MISNPINLFVTGSDQKKFTYEGGTTLYHFSPRENGLSEYMENNLVFFANDEEHALDVLKRMCEFVMECSKKYIEYQTKNHFNPHAEEFESRSKMVYNKFKGYVDRIEEGRIKLSLAPTNQFYKVGWASNDTIG